MADVFISYSRHNIDFARRLFDALQQGGRDSWVDWDDIPMSGEWFRAIQEGIESANGFVFIITPESLTSPVCMLEVSHAIASHKRIIPVVHRDVVISDAFGAIAAIKPTEFLSEILADRDLLTMARANWRVLESINWIFFRDEDDFATGLKRLIDVVETDYNRVRLHTRLLVRANEWKDKNFDKSYLLVGTDLRDAASWFKVSGDKPPAATEEHKAYIRASLHQEEEEKAARDQQIAELNAASQRASSESVRAERQSRRAGIATVVAALLVALLGVAALFAGNQLSRASDQIDAANDQIGTATVAQGQAFNDRSTATVVMGAAVVRADAADTQVAFAGATLTPIPLTLTPIPPTLTQAELFRLDAINSQQILQELNDVMLLLDAGIYVDTDARMGRLIELFPDNPVAYRARGTVQFRQEEFAEAVESYTQSINLDPNYAPGYFSRGYTYVTLGENALAVADFTRVLELQSTNEVAYYNRGLAYAFSGDFQMALDDFTRAVALNPQYTEAFNNRGLAYEALGDFDSAALNFRRALELESLFVQACNSLNRVLLQLRQPLDLCAGTPTPTLTPTRFVQGRPAPTLAATTAFNPTVIPFDTIEPTNPFNGTDSSGVFPATQSPSFSTLPPFYQQQPLYFSTPIPFGG